MKWNLLVLSVSIVTCVCKYANHHLLKGKRHSEFVYSNRQCFEGTNENKAFVTSSWLKKKLKWRIWFVKINFCLRLTVFFLCLNLNFTLVRLYHWVECLIGVRSDLQLKTKKTICDCKNFLRLGPNILNDVVIYNL